MKTYAAVATVGMLALASSAMAGTKTYTGQGGALNDTLTTGVPAVTRFEIMVADSGTISSFDEVVLNGLVHTWAGDLVITLTHKDTGTSVVLVDRPGVPASTFGESQDYNGNYSFQDGFAPIPDEFSTVTGGSTTAPLPSGIYGPHTGNSLASFVGENKAGLWSLVVQDLGAGDTGTLGSWGFTVTNVPAPGALALLGLAGVASRRRRRA